MLEHNSIVQRTLFISAAAERAERKFVNIVRGSTVLWKQFTPELR